MTDLLDRLSWNLCPHLRFMLKGERQECRRCPGVEWYPQVDSAGTSFCRHMAEKAVREQLAELKEPTDAMVRHFACYEESADEIRGFWRDAIDEVLKP